MCTEPLAIPVSTSLQSPVIKRIVMLSYLGKVYSDCPSEALCCAICWAFR
jgi:hypothetical protein